MKFKRLLLNESITSVDLIHIREWLEQMGIENYTINDDGTVDVDGDVNISNKNLTEIPIQFGKVNGNFWCNNNELTTLKGVPRIVGGIFSCSIHWRIYNTHSKK